MCARSYADLPLHNGRVPQWLAERMTRLGGAVVEAIQCEYGRSEVLTRLSDPFWFQAFGAVLGMDWHSSGITTSVMGALKRAVNPISRELGLAICGGRGRHSRKTPDELRRIADATGLDGEALVRASRLTAKIDNTAVQDGFQIYLHTFVIAEDGEWAVVQQGMNPDCRMARRYHWHSPSVRSFVSEPHTAVVGENQGLILNLTHHEAEPTRSGIVAVSREHPDRMLGEIRHIVLPRHHDVRAADVDLKRLGAVLATAYDSGVQDFANLLLVRGLGPRTLQSLALVSEVIHGTPSRFEDPARFSFAHGGKDGHPFPVPLKIYDQTIAVLKHAVGKAKAGRGEKLEAIRRLDRIARRVENTLEPVADLEAVKRKEWRDATQNGGRTVGGGKRAGSGRQPTPRGPVQPLLFDPDAAP